MSQRTAFYCLLLLVLVLPLPLGSNRDWFWMPLASVAFLVAAMLCWQMGRGSIKPSPALRSARPALLALLAWLIFGLLQFALPLPWLDRPGSTISVEPTVSMSTWLQSLFYCTLFVLTLQLAQRRRQLRMLLGTMVLAGVLQATYGALMTLSGFEYGALIPKTAGRGVATGTFINRNHFAGFLEICLAVGMGALIAEIARSRTADSTRAWLRNLTATLLGPKMLLRLSLAVMVIALVLSRSRMGNTAFFASLLISGALALALIRRPPRSLVILLASLITIDVLIIGTWFGVEQVVDRIQTTGQYIEATGRYRDEERLDVDVETVNALTRYRWLGSGGGTFYTVFPAQRPSDITSFFDHAHNDYLEFLLEFGIIGIAPLVAFVLMTFASGLHTLRKRHDPLLKGCSFAVVMGFVAIGIHATVDFNLRIPANASFLMVLAGLGWAANGMRRRRNSNNR